MPTLASKDCSLQLTSYIWFMYLFILGMTWGKITILTKYDIISATTTSLTREFAVDTDWGAQLDLFPKLYNRSRISQQHSVAFCHRLTSPKMSRTQASRRRQRTVKAIFHTRTLSHDGTAHTWILQYAQFLSVMHVYNTAVHKSRYYTASRKTAPPARSVTPSNLNRLSEFFYRRK